MKSIFLTVCLIFFFASTGLVNAQEAPNKLHTVVLNGATDKLAEAYNLIVSPGDSVKFKSDNGEFVVFINEPYRVFDTEESELNIKVNNPTPESDIYVVRNTDNIVKLSYTIYCITYHSWPVSWSDAPPKIIIVVNND